MRRVGALASVVAAALFACSSPDDSAGPATSGGSGGASGGAGGTTPGAAGGGAAGATLEVVPAVFTEANAPLTPITDGAAIPLALPPQGGHVLFVGALMRNLPTTTIKIVGRLIDPTTGQLVAQDARTVVVQPVEGEPGRVQTDNRTYSQQANITVCPDYAPRAIDGQPYDLEIEVTPLYVNAAVPVTVRRSVVPTCGAGADNAACTCECSAGYTLGKCPLKD